MIAVGWLLSTGGKRFCHMGAMHPPPCQEKQILARYYAYHQGIDQNQAQYHGIRNEQIAIGARDLRADDRSDHSDNFSFVGIALGTVACPQTLLPDSSTPANRLPAESASTIPDSLHHRLQQRFERRRRIGKAG